MNYKLTVIQAFSCPKRLSDQARYIMQKSFLISCFFVMRALAAVINCFANAPFLRPVVVDDCADVFETMQEGDKVWAPMHFTRERGTGFRVPHRWHKNSCTVLIDMLKDGDDDSFPLGTVVQAASNIVRACVLDSSMQGLGGRAIIGPEKKMLVVVSGTLDPPQRPQDILFKANTSTLNTLPYLRNANTS